MKKTRNRLLSVLLAVCMVPAVSQAAAWAYPYNGIYVGGVYLDGSEGKTAYATTNTETDAVTVQPVFDKNRAWNIEFETGVPTLKDANIGVSAPYSSKRQKSSDIFVDAGDLTIDVQGTNTATGPQTVFNKAVCE